MNFSIGKFLLLNLLLAITVTTSFTVVANYYFDKRDIQRHLDAFLVQSALTIEALVGEYVNYHINSDIPKQIHLTLTKNIDRSTAPLIYHHLASNAFQFQVWGKQGNLLLHSADFPKQSLTGVNIGFFDSVIQGEKWRIYHLLSLSGNFTVEVAERHLSRNELVQMMALDDLYIMLSGCLLSGILIWIIIGRGLKNFSEVVTQVAARTSDNLTPVDVTRAPAEIKPLVLELNQLFQRLQQTVAREQRFAADAAHELRTPLAALRVQAQVARHATDLQQRKDTLDKVLHCVDRCTHVVKQLLALSCVAAGNPLQISQSIDLSKLVAEVMAPLVPSALEKNIDIAFHGDPHSMIKIDSGSASVLVRNLVDNAIRYTPEAGQVRVNVLRQHQQVVFQVIDDGPGIAAELRDRVFERFYRALGNKASGSGLGLSIVQQIAALYQATIQLKTPDNGKGLLFEVRFLADYPC